MITTNGTAALGIVKATGVSGRGFTPEELAEAALDKIISVGSNSHPAIREQAEAFKDHIRSVLVAYGYQVIRSNYTTLSNRFRNAGHPELTVFLEN